MKYSLTNLMAEVFEVVNSDNPKVILDKKMIDLCKEETLLADLKNIADSSFDHDTANLLLLYSISYLHHMDREERLLENLKKTPCVPVLN